MITGQVNTNFLGTDTFQETDIFGITLPIVKHSYKVTDPNDMCQIVSEALYTAKNGRPGLIDIPKDIGAEQLVNCENTHQNNIQQLIGYRFQYKISKKLISNVLKAIKTAERPLLYVGGGTIASNAYHELFILAHGFAIPITTTLMGKGAFHEKDPLSVGMLGMHGTAYANFAVSECDLLIAVGARFDDRVTGKLDSFASFAKILHFDIDPAAIGAQLAFPHRQVVCISGDSSIQMCIQELGTIAQYKLPIRIMIINNHYQGMVRQWQESFYENRCSHSSMDQGQPNFVALANSYNIKALSIQNVSELEEKLIAFNEYPHPILFEFLVVENENCYPMVSPGATNAAMSGITYKSDELDILQRYSVTDSNIDDFLSIKTEESKAAEAVQQSTQSQEDKNYEEFH